MSPKSCSVAGQKTQQTARQYSQHAACVACTKTLTQIKTQRCPHKQQSCRSQAAQCARHLHKTQAHRPLTAACMCRAYAVCYLPARLLQMSMTPSFMHRLARGGSSPAARGTELPCNLLRTHLHIGQEAEGLQLLL